MTIPASLRRQRSHVLFVLTDPADAATGVADWYAGQLRDTGTRENVVGVRGFELSEVDPTHGRHAPLPYRFLALYDLALDGPEEAAPIVEGIVADSRVSGVAGSWATWMSFPLGELAGEPTPDAGHVVLAFANPVEGREREFREWYPTRHIRHALNLPSLVSGQCHLRTEHQFGDAAAIDAEIIAVYEQTGEPADLLADFAAIPVEVFSFPAMHAERFAESIYRRIV